MLDHFQDRAETVAERFENSGEEVWSVAEIFDEQTDVAVMAVVVGDSGEVQSVGGPSEERVSA